MDLLWIQCALLLWTRTSLPLHRKEPDAETLLLALLSEVSFFPRFHGCVVPLTSLRLHVRLLAGWHFSVHDVLEEDTFHTTAVHVWCPGATLIEVLIARFPLVWLSASAPLVTQQKNRRASSKT